MELVVGIAWLLVPFFVSADARKIQAATGKSPGGVSPLLWFVLCLFCGLIPMIIYLICRPSAPVISIAAPQPQPIIIIMEDGKVKSVQNAPVQFQAAPVQPREPIQPRKPLRERLGLPEEEFNPPPYEPNPQPHISSPRPSGQPIVYGTLPPEPSPILNFAWKLVLGLLILAGIAYFLQAK